MSTTLGSNIKVYRKNKGITQEELSSLLNVTPQAVSKWESGASLPDVSMLVPLAQIFGVSTDVLLGYDLIAEQEEETHRIRKTMWGIRESEGDRAENALKACEYLMTETNLHPSNYSVITSYVEFVADLSMYVDPTLEGYFQDQMDHINEIYKDAKRKGAYLISHCSDRELIEMTHYALAWIYIHEEDFDNARDHINVLPSLKGVRLKEKIEMELTFFEKGFDSMKVDIKEDSVYLFRNVASILNTIAQNYGWWGELDEALDMINYCKGILQAFAAKKDYISINNYMRALRSLEFFKMVAYKKAGDSKGAEECYASFAKEVQESDFTDEQKQDIMNMLHGDIAHYSKYS